MSLKELKKNRLTPAERFVLGQIDGCKPTTKLKGNVAWHNKDGRRLFEQDFVNGYLDVSYSNIWEFLEDKFGLNNKEIRKLLTNLLYDYTDNGKLKMF